MRSAWICASPRGFFGRKVRGRLAAWGAPRGGVKRSRSCASSTRGSAVARHAPMAAKLARAPRERRPVEKRIHMECIADAFIVIPETDRTDQARPRSGKVHEATAQAGLARWSRICGVERAAFKA